MIIYLYYSGEVPDEYTLTLEFDEGQGLYEYKVPVLKLPEISAHELTDRKMVVLIPFYVLKLRYALKKKGKKDMTDESFMIDVDIMCEEHEKAMVEKDNLLRASAKALLKSGMKEQEVHAITKISLDVIASLKEEIEK